MTVIEQMLGCELNLAHFCEQARIRSLDVDSARQDVVRFMCVLAQVADQRHQTVWFFLAIQKYGNLYGFLLGLARDRSEI